ncbi:MAG: heavy metal-binding domain-containing protein [Eubacterium sp.]|nr:heavy metal-binding domain-containing protein [Eubacterium sp.]
MESCVLCKKEIEGIKKVFTTEPETHICGTCFERICLLKQYSKADDYFVANKSFEVLSGYLADIDDVIISDKLKEHLTAYDEGQSFEVKSAEARARAEEIMRKEAEEIGRQKAEYQKKNFDFLMTSASCLEGYKVVAHYGLVFGETVFKTSFLNSVVAGVRDIGNTFKSLGKSTEMSGVMNVLYEARQFAIDKMKDDAKRYGANAIIAIDSESSFGTDLMHITIYGTAVYVEPIFDEE